MSRRDDGIDRNDRSDRSDRSGPRARFDALVAALAEPGALPGGGPGRARLVETHVSCVLLSGDRAFKLKKPVDLGFLDFTTRARRHAMALEELRLNRRFAPDVYLGLASARLEDGNPRVGPVTESPDDEGEWIVVMRRLPGDRMLDLMVVGGRATAADARAVARTVARCHARAETNGEIARHGSAAAVAEAFETNAGELAGLVAAAGDGRRVRRIADRLLAWVDARRVLLAAREQGGFVRDLHGDLHAGNVCLPPGEEPILYDALEFSPALRCGDVAGEVAFLVADLEARGAEGLADAFVREYAATVDDDGLGQLLPGYATHRALVRAKVEHLRGDREGLAARHLEVASRRSRTLVPPVLVVVRGLSCSGKTTLADALSRHAGLDAIDTDRTRKRLAGIAPGTPAAAPPGAGLYTAAATAETYAEVLDVAGERLARGHAVAVSGTFLLREQRARARQTARAHGADVLFVELTAPRSVLLERMAGRSGGPSDADAEVLDWQIARDETDPETVDRERLRLDVSTHDVAALVERVLLRAAEPLDRGAAA